MHYFSLEKNFDIAVLRDELHHRHLGISPGPVSENEFSETDIASD
jgi:hypothetical protein